MGLPGRSASISLTMSRQRSSTRSTRKPARSTLAEFVDERGLTDPCLTTDQDDAAAASNGLPQVTRELRQLGFAFE